MWSRFFFSNVVGKVSMQRCLLGSFVGMSTGTWGALESRAALGKQDSTSMRSLQGITRFLWTLRMHERSRAGVSAKRGEAQVPTK